MSIKFNRQEKIDLSWGDIVYDELGRSIRSEDRARSTGPHLISDVISYLESTRGTFRQLDLSNNILSDEGISPLVKELQHHKDLEELNLSNNMISNSGLLCLKPLLELDNLVLLDISENYGPSDEVLTDLLTTIPERNKDKLRVIY